MSKRSGEAQLATSSTSDVNHSKCRSGLELTLAPSKGYTVPTRQGPRPLTRCVSAISSSRSMLLQRPTAASSAHSKIPSYATLCPRRLNGFKNELPSSPSTVSPIPASLSSSPSYSGGGRSPTSDSGSVVSAEKSTVVGLEKSKKQFGNDTGSGDGDGGGGHNGDVVVSVVSGLEDVGNGSRSSSSVSLRSSCSSRNFGKTLALFTEIITTQTKISKVNFQT